MTMVAHLVDAVIGVDSHRDTHDFVLLAPNRTELLHQQIPNSDDGFRQLFQLVREHSPGPHLMAGLEGTRSYGVGLNRHLTSAGIRVIEVEQPIKSRRRGIGKTDHIDATLAAEFVLRSDIETLPSPRADGIREALQILLGARSEMTTLSTSQTNRLRALLLSGDDTDKTLARGSVTFAKLDALARRRGTGDRPEQLVRTAEIRRLAINLRGLRRELLDGLKTLSQLVDSLAPNLQHRTGVGPVTAAQILVAWSHPGRVRNDAAFAALAGTCPLPASSGQRTRHRLNRGGDRALNSAIHAIAITR